MADGCSFDWGCRRETDYSVDEAIYLISSLPVAVAVDQPLHQEPAAFFPHSYVLSMIPSVIQSGVDSFHSNVRVEEEEQ